MIMISFLRSLFRWPFCSKRELAKPFCSKRELFLAEKSFQCENPPVLPFAVELPDDVIRQIALKLEIGDFIRMGAVCRSWAAVVNVNLWHDAQQMMQNSAHSQMPWLLLDHSPSTSTDLIHFYSLSEGRSYNFLKPEFRRESICCGTTNGWLIMFDGWIFDPSLFLWNPISDQIIDLPSLLDIPSYTEYLNEPDLEPDLDRGAVAKFVQRVEVFSVSGGNTEEHVVVAAILGLNPLYTGKGQTLVLCKPEEDEEWTIIGSHTDLKCYDDILYHNGMLYVVQGNLDDEEEVVEEEGQGGKFEVRTVTLDNCEVSLGLINAKANPQQDVIKDGEEEICLPKGEGILPCTELLWWFHLGVSTFSELLLITRFYVVFGFCHEDEVVDENLYDVHKETRDFKVEVIKFVNDESLFASTTCTSLKNQALFVGRSGTVASDSKLDQDCIWFLPSQPQFLESLDSGVFYLREKMIKRCFPSIRAPSNLGWFTPKLL